MADQVDVLSGNGIRNVNAAGETLPNSPDAAQYVSDVDDQGDHVATLRNKGQQTQTISSGGTTGSTAVTLAAGAVPAIGQLVYFTDQTFEVHRVKGVAGQVVTIDAALTSVGTHAAIAWDIAADNGPTTNAINPGGVPLSAPVAYDPVAAAYEIVRSLGGAFQVAATAQVGGGATPVKLRDLAGTATAIKTSAGTLYGLQIINTSGAAAYIQIYNKATGSVTVGTDTPDMEILVGAGAQVNVPIPACGIKFGTAISAASTTAEKGNTGSASGVEIFAQIA